MRSVDRTLVGKICLCQNTENAVKMKNSTRFIALFAKRCKKYEVKKIFCYRKKIFRQTSTRAVMNVGRRTFNHP